MKTENKIAHYNRVIYLLSSLNKFYENQCIVENRVHTAHNILMVLNDIFASNTHADIEMLLRQQHSMHLIFRPLIKRTFFCKKYEPTRKYYLYKHLNKRMAENLDWHMMKTCVLSRCVQQMLMDINIRTNYAPIEDLYNSVIEKVYKNTNEKDRVEILWLYYE